MKILTIDDSKLALLQVERVIKDLVPNAEVIKTQDPHKGVEIAKTQHVEIGFVIVDYNMEAMTGIDVIDAILPCFKATQLSLLTANTQFAIKNEAEKRGIHFLSKDGLKEQLENILKKILVGTA
ncbi:MAG: response regulator [Bdellovibrionota bacterium]